LVKFLQWFVNYRVDKLSVKSYKITARANTGNGCTKTTTSMSTSVDTLGVNAQAF